MQMNATLPLSAGLLLQETGNLSSARHPRPLKKNATLNASQCTFAGKIRRNLDWILQVLQSHIQKGKGSCYLTAASHSNCLDTVFRQTGLRGICWAQTFTKPRKSMLEIPLSALTIHFFPSSCSSHPLLILICSSSMQRHWRGTAAGWEAKSSCVIDIPAEETE